jgi:hypothetical protein
VNFATADRSAQAGSDYVANSGVVTFSPGQITRTVLVSTLNDVEEEINETFVVNLSNASPNATIIQDQGLGTILDDDTPPTKFYVVDDASQNRTYEYDPAGALVESYGLDSGNAAPRGAASSVAGDRVWVVDANRKVYVYDNAGALMGSWTAGSLAPNSTVEGIATNGTDVWIVDGKSDKIFRYAGAAGRLAGSQNAASSFSLNSGNRDPKDIVTDGAHLWVVNNSSTDKVFKYTTGGTLVGSWTITTSGASSPTGITLDPSAPAHLWIVDSGTDRVYQYNNAVSLPNNSSKAADAFFALAAGNTNPQGIADPPAGDNVVVAAEMIALSSPAVWPGAVRTSIPAAGDDREDDSRLAPHSPAVFELENEAARSIPLHAAASGPRAADIDAAFASDPDEDLDEDQNLLSLEFSLRV